MPYEADLAFIHDTGFGSFADRAAPGIIAILRRRGIRSGTVVDLGCGSGILAAALTDAGYSVLGVDISPAMIALARRRAPSATFVAGSMHRVDLPRCDAVTAIGECFNYAFDTQGSIRRLFGRIHRALRPGGLLVFDLAEPGVAGPQSRKSWVEGEGWAVLVDAREHRGTLERRIVTYRRRGAAFRRGEETHRLRLYTAAELQGQLEDIGFKTQVLEAYGRQPMLPGRRAILATREP